MSDTEIKINILMTAIQEKQDRISELQQSIKNDQAQLGELVLEHTIAERACRHEQNMERGQQWKESDPEGYNAFLEEIRQRNQAHLEEGARLGWWDISDTGEMLAPPIVVDSSKLPDNALMAHVMAEVGIFPSVTQARKNGWDKPLTTGVFTVTKKKIRIKVI